VSRGYVDRVRSDFRKTFDTPSGKHTLMWLYENLHGKQSTFPEDGNSHKLAFNEGKRMAWLLIMENLREEDMDMRRQYEEYLTGKRREALNE